MSKATEKKSKKNPETKQGAGQGTKPVMKENPARDTAKKAAETKAAAQTRKDVKPYLWKQYEDWLHQIVEENKSDPLYQKYFQPIIDEEKPYVDSVFVSVVMRTQGRRPQALREALLCMMAQSDQDFEVLLIAHKPNEEQKQSIEQILDELDPEFRKKVRYFVLDMGKRSMPLNVGFAHARGEYIAILDDDDIVFEDWVEEYHKAARKAPGAVLHAFMFAQDWDGVQMASGDMGLRSISAPRALYCVPFDAVRQLQVNRCPTTGLAFPRVAFAEYGFHFDEELTTTEDWDFLMRVSMVFGVTDICTPTAVYRLWKNLENSSVIHPQEEWTKNYGIVRNKYRKYMMLIKPEHMPIVMDDRPVAAAGEPVVRTEIVDDGSRELLGEVVSSFSWKLGRMLTYIPRVCREFVVQVKRNGWKSATLYLDERRSKIGSCFKNLFRKG